MYIPFGGDGEILQKEWREIKEEEIAINQKLKSNDGKLK